MKKIVGALVAGVVLGSTGFAMAGPSRTQANIHYAGVWCKTDTPSKSVLCIRESGTGFGVGISRQYVMVMSADSGKTVFVRKQR